MKVPALLQRLPLTRKIRHLAAVLAHQNQTQVRDDPLFDAHTGETSSHGVRIRYYEYGPADAEMTVVFVHGFTLAATSFFLQVDYLRETWPDVRILLLDLRGHGQSEKIRPADCLIDHAADDVLAVLDARPAAGRILMLGHSLGCPVALAVLRRAPDTLRGQVAGMIHVAGAVDVMARRGLTQILNTSAVEALFVAYRSRPASVLRLRRRLGKLVPTVLELFFFFRHTPDALIEFHAGLIADTPTETILGFAAELRGHQEFDALDHLAGLPGYILVGDKDFVTPISQSRLLHSLWPGSRIQIAPNAAHMLPVEAPGIVSAALDRQLLQLRPGRPRDDAQ